MFVHFAQLFCRPETAVKDKVYGLKLIRKGSKDNNKSQAWCLLGTRMLLLTI